MCQCAFIHPHDDGYVVKKVQSWQMQVLLSDDVISSIVDNK